MNIVYLLEHISDQLHTIVRHFRNDTMEFSTICKRVDLNDNYENNTTLKNLLKLDITIPKLTVDDNKNCYCIISSDNDKFLIGPIILDEVYYEYNLFRDDLYICNLDKFLSFILLLNNSINNTTITKNEIIDYNFPVKDLDHKIKEQFVSTLFDNIENSKKHNSHYKEVRELNSITNGDVEGLMKSWEEDLAGVYGRLAKDDERQSKNLAITTLILASRAAIQGGLHPEISYTIVDKYIYELEELKDLSKILPLMRKAEILYTELVRDLNKPKKNVEYYHPKVENAKDYILSNIHSPLTIKSISDNLGLNANYLAEIFKKQENISIPNYIMRAKIDLAKNMLIYSNSTYIAIANNLGFSSQSYFTQKFRELTTLTPKKFRDLYGIKNSQK